MSKRKDTEAQIIAALKRVEAGRAAEAEARECGVSRHTMYRLEGEVRRAGSERGATAAATGR